MLEAIMHVNINGPEAGCSDARDIVQCAVKKWYSTKNRRKLPKPVAETIPSTTQGKPVGEAVKDVMSALNLSDMSSGSSNNNATCTDSDSSFVSGTESDDYDYGSD